MSSTFHQSMKYREEGLSVLPVEEGGKKPATHWKKFQQRQPTLGELRQWFDWDTRYNIGIVTGQISGIVVVDFDDKERAREFFKRNKDIVTVIVETRRGAHFYFSHSGTQISNSTGSFDVRGDGGYVVAPPSVVQGHEYRFVKGYDDFQKLNPMPELVAKKKTNGKKVTDGKKYISAIRAVSGEKGHAATFRACCKLRDAGMSPQDALAALVEWNETNAEPPWTVGELLHKVNDVFGV